MYELRVEFSAGIHRSDREMGRGTTRLRQVRWSIERIQAQPSTDPTDAPGTTPR